MCPENKNNLLTLYYNEKKKSETRSIEAHVDSCYDCQKFLGELEQIEHKLDSWKDQKPSPDILTRVMDEVALTPKHSTKQKPENILTPVLQIAAGTVFIFLAAYVLQMKLSLSPFWQNIQNNWLVQFIGSFGLSVLIILAIGTFITLSIAPIMFLDSREKNNFS